MDVTRLTAPVLALGLVAGCVQVMPGQAQMTPPKPYLQRIDDAVRRDRAHAAQIRQQDPCSLINLDAAAKLGKIKYIGTDGKAASCDIFYDVPKKTPTAQDPNADLDLVPGLVAEISAGDVTTDSTGKGETTMTPMQDTCFGGLRSGYQNEWGPELIMFSIDMSDETSAGCEELRSVIQASRPNVAHPALRADSRFQPHSKITSLDPCGPLDTLTGEDPVEIFTGPNPFDCDYRIKGDKEDKTRRYIQHGYWKLDDIPVKARKDAELTTMSGVPVQVDTMADEHDCMVFAYVGRDHPVRGADPLSAQQWVDVIVVQATESQDLGCPGSRAVTEQAIRLYQAS